MRDNYDDYKERQMRERRKNIITWTLVTAAALLVLTALIFGVPVYQVWASSKRGEAEYVRAEQNRKIRVEEAKANLEAEKLNAQAEIERAKGAAEAIRIENGSITPAYIQYIWVRQQNANANNKIIYIPTEAGLPVLEAGRAAGN